jgi:hypothetical protein
MPRFKKNNKSRKKKKERSKKIERGDLAELGPELGVNFVESATKSSELFASLIGD